MMLLLLLGEGWCSQCHYDGGCDKVLHIKSPWSAPKVVTQTKAFGCATQRKSDNQII
jgi:hypothetical protein